MTLPCALMATAPLSEISAFVVMAHTNAIDSRPRVEAGVDLWFERTIAATSDGDAARRVWLRRFGRSHRHATSGAVHCGHDRDDVPAPARHDLLAHPAITSPLRALVQAYSQKCSCCSVPIAI